MHVAPFAVCLCVELVVLLALFFFGRLSVDPDWVYLSGPPHTETLPGADPVISTRTYLVSLPVCVAVLLMLPVVVQGIVWLVTKTSSNP